ncbi:cytosolic endo-beta-N-acetylglucosaminidase [Planococcus citri]|uniref:cytosolic endo-beta-N-acetylglucosaminidase n=1 Tax=Planococcus citri TaxID=170843 RepID=UPI0031F9BF36
MHRITECEPLKTLDDVLSWDDKSDWSVFVKPLKSTSKYCYESNSFHCHKRVRKPIKALRSCVPKTLVCHDMKGGYLDDRFVNGTKYKDQYLFYHWPAIDTFVYFSHYFITIPPLMWINAAHFHGVEILGTVITEFNEGKKIWDQLLTNDDMMESFISKLVSICKHYNFDGYLMNIENSIDKPHLPKLITFLEKLKSQLGTRKVIWYDSVSLTEGTLTWQNELNKHNKTAFEICDGIFLNYGWKEINLETSLRNSGGRQLDVYVGIDVFGRGVFGGGGFNTDKAMEVVRSNGLSMALFATGWTYETQASDDKFFEVERKFWAKLWPHLYIHLLDTLPFKITFNQGVSHEPFTSSMLWYNLANQEYNLPMPSCLSDNFETGCTSHFFDDGVSGGCSVMLNYKESETQFHRLLLCDFSCSLEVPLKLTIVSKWPSEYSPFKLILWVENEIRNYTIILQVSKDNEPVSADGYDYSSPAGLIKQINAEKVTKFRDNEWISNEFSLPFDGKITGIDAQLQDTVLIGLLSLE